MTTRRGPARKHGDKAKLLTVSAGAVLPAEPVPCTHGRTETYSAARPDGTDLNIWRCLDCGAQDVTRKDTINGEAG